LTGVHRFQPTLATRPVLFWPVASPAAALRATALASVPPNQAARPRSWKARDRVLRAMMSLRGQGKGFGPRLPPPAPGHAGRQRSGGVQPGPRVRQRAYRAAARWRARAASTSRSFGGAVVTRASSSRSEAAATSATARSKASLLARDGCVLPLILRT